MTRRNHPNVNGGERVGHLQCTSSHLPGCSTARSNPTFSDRGNGIVKQNPPFTILNIKAPHRTGVHSKRKLTRTPESQILGQWETIHPHGGDLGSPSKTTDFAKIESVGVANTNRQFGSRPDPRETAMSIIADRDNAKYAPQSNHRKIRPSDLARLLNPSAERTGVFAFTIAEKNYRRRRTKRRQ